MSTSKKKRRWPWILGIAAAALGLTAFLYLKDEPLGDHSDLEPASYSATPKEVAVIDRWIEAASLIKQNKKTIDLSPLWNLQIDDWEENLHGPLFDSLASPLRIVTVAAAAPRVAFTKPLQYTLFDITREGSFGNFSEAVFLLDAAVVARLSRGDPQGASETAALRLNASDAFLERGGYLVDHLVALGVSASIVNRTQELLDRPLPRPALVNLFTGLAREPNYVASLTNSMRHEFKLIKTTILKLDAAEFDQIAAFFPERPKAPPLLQLRRKRTANQLAFDFQRMLTAISQRPVERPQRQQRNWNGSWLQRLSPNALGEWILDSLSGGSADPLQLALDMTEKSIALRRLAQVRAALLLHHIEHGALPQSLEELMPSQFAALPLDPYDLQPLRYDHTAGILWSIGTDLRDDGGDRSDFSQPVSKGDDLTVRILPPTR